MLLIWLQEQMRTWWTVMWQKTCVSHEANIFRDTQYYPSITPKQMPTKELNRYIYTQDNHETRHSWCREHRWHKSGEEQTIKTRQEVKLDKTHEEQDTKIKQETNQDHDRLQNKTGTKLKHNQDQERRHRTQVKQTTQGAKQEHNRK